MSRIALPLIRRKVDALRRVYDQLPALACQGLCSESCGPIMMSPLEYRRIAAHLGGEPPTATGIECPLLTPGQRCRAYPVRPLICRLWGLVEAMRCPFGCVPERWVTDEESYRLIDQVRRISGGYATMHNQEQP